MTSKLAPSPDGHAHAFIRQDREPVTGHIFLFSIHSVGP